MCVSVSVSVRSDSSKVLPTNILFEIVLLVRVACELFVSSISVAGNRVELRKALTGQKLTV